MSCYLRPHEYYYAMSIESDSRGKPAGKPAVNLVTSTVNLVTSTVNSGLPVSLLVFGRGGLVR